MKLVHIIFIMYTTMHNDHKLTKNALANVAIFLFFYLYYGDLSLNS